MIMADEVERMAESLDAIKSALLKRKLTDAQLSEASLALETLRGLVAVSGEPRHSILELKGLGKEIWEGIDVDEYIREERRSWR